MAGSAATAVILSPVGAVKPAVGAVKLLSAALVAAAQCSAEVLFFWFHVNPFYTFWICSVVK
jgi:hypothetical protein